MAQRLRAPEFNAQHPQSGLQPSKIRSDVFFWHAGRASMHKKISVFFFFQKEREVITL